MHVQGSGEDNGVEKRGVRCCACSIIWHLAQAGVSPALSIITPFVIVADRLRQTVCESGMLNDWVEEDVWR